MTRKWTVRWTLLSVLICLLFQLIPPGAAENALPGEAKTVRVGYVNHVGYEEGGEGEYKTGYGYEYLQRISYLAGWEYEYVYGTFSELFNQLMNGEIDLMGDISYTPERAKSIHYSAYPMSKEYYYLVCTSDNQELRTLDLAALDGKTIGVTRDSFQAGLLEEWIETHQVPAEIVTYGGSKDVINSLETGASAAIVITKTASTAEYATIANIGYSEVYFGLAKHRDDLLADINAALYSIQSTDPLYNDKVTSKYASYQNVDTNLTDRELQWLAEHPVIHMGYLKNFLPLSDEIAEETANGLIRYLTDQVSVTLGLGDTFRVRYDGFDTMAEMVSALQEGQIDAGFPFISDFWNTEQFGLSETYEVAGSSVSLVYKGEYDAESIRTVAVSDQSPLRTFYASLWYPECRILPCEDEIACLAAVMNGAADASLMIASRAEDYLSYPKYHVLSSVACPKNVSFCFKLEKKNTSLLMILNRAISALDSRTVLDRMNTFLPRKTSYTLEDFVYMHPVEVFTAAAVVILLIAGSFVYYVIQSSRSRRKLDAARNEALRASAVKSTFLYNMSHDIRTPMNAILGFTREASRHLQEPAILKSSLDKVQRSGEYLLNIINDVLDMTQLDSGQGTVVESLTDLSQVADDVVTLLGSDAREKQQRLTLETDFSHPLVLTDGFRLRQILMNLVDNSIKYTKEGGNIRLSAAETPGEEGGSQYTFVVEDNGMGMSEEFQTQVFEAFTRENNSTISGIPGTGLGMSIVKGYTDLMGGAVALESQVEKGTKVTVRFPFRHAAASAEQEAQTETQHSDALKNKRILIVEDNEINRMLAENVLEEFGMITDSAENGRVAVEKLREAMEEESAEKPFFDFVLMDIQMPVMDGYQAAREIRHMPRDYCLIPIIALSANAFESDKQASLEAGMNAHLPKPLNVDLLEKTLLEYCKR